MLRLLTIVGARPQIIKAAALSRAIRNQYLSQIEECILHTGQHYDADMSAVFFDELGIPQPTYNLHVGSGTHAQQTARMLEGIEQVLLSAEQPFDGIIIYGDTNSTVAGALAGSKLHIPIFHVEAGLRSYNMAMPEELNRIVADQLSSILFAPTQTAVDNLAKEGFLSSLAKFADGRLRKVIWTGDIMFDNSVYYSQIAETKSHILQELSLTKKRFALATIHRPANTDNPTNLAQIFEALLAIAETEQLPIVLPVHPRTRALLPKQLTLGLLERIQKSAYLRIVSPASFYEMILLEKYAAVVFTDSGGVQKEAFFFNTPCVILRPETEWVEILKTGAGIIADASYERILEAYQQLKETQVEFPQLFGDAHAAEYILQQIINYMTA